MINLRINGKTRQIPTASEFTVEQYIKLLNTSKERIYDYIAIALDMPKPDLLNSKIRGLEKVKAFIEFSDPWSEKAYTTHLAQRYMKDAKLEDVKLNLVGHRMLFESKLKENGTKTELALFCLAMATMPNEFDFEKVQERSDSFKTLSYAKALPVAVFFYRNLKRCHYDERSSLARLASDTLTKIKRQKSSQVSSFYRITMLLMKLKELRALSIYRIQTFLRLRTS